MRRSGGGGGRTSSTPIIQCRTVALLYRLHQWVRWIQIYAGIQKQVALPKLIATRTVADSCLVILTNPFINSTHTLTLHMYSAFH